MYGIEYLRYIYIYIYILYLPTTPGDFVRVNVGTFSSTMDCAFGYGSIFRAHGPTDSFYFEPSNFGDEQISEKTEIKQ